jgi:hypothetical protein
MVKWEIGEMGNDEMGNWQNVKLAKWENGKTRNGETGNGEMGVLDVFSDWTWPFGHENTEILVPNYEKIFYISNNDGSMETGFVDLTCTIPSM